MYPKFVLVSRPEAPLIGTFVYGLVWNHKDLVDALPGYVKVHGGGWYDKDDVKKTITLYGGSGDYGEPKLSFLDRIPRELRKIDEMIEELKRDPEGKGLAAKE